MVILETRDLKKQYGTGDFFLYKGETRRIIIFPVGSAGGIYLRPVLH
jgi:hypothetical protein